jgi:hypothetical protein
MCCNMCCKKESHQSNGAAGLLAEAEYKPLEAEPSKAESDQLVEANSGDGQPGDLAVAAEV